MFTMTLDCTLCQEVVSKLINRYQWSLLSLEELTRQLHQRVTKSVPYPTGENNPHVEHSQQYLSEQAVNLYCETWYHACCGEGTERENAFAELARHLYDQALYKYKDPSLAQELAQTTIVNIFQKLDTCRKPGAFLAFVHLKLRQAATDHFRKRDREQQRIKTLPDSTETEFAESTVDWLVDLGLPPLDQMTVNIEITTAILQHITQMVQDSPRAKNQFFAVIYKFLYGLSDSEIAQTMETSVSNVHILRTRGLTRLRKDETLRNYWADL